jgi:RES domain-containing protein
VPVAYCASTLSLAVLELLVHVDPVDIPDDLVAVEIEFPDHLPLRRMAAGILPANWRQEAGKAALQALGDGWVRAGAELGLLVPSVIVPRETNLLLNPAHADAAKVKIVSTEPFAFDPRLF